MGGTGQNNYRWSYGVRFIPGVIDRAKWRNTLTYQVNSRLSIGIEYNPIAGKASPLANFVAMKETKKRPAFILGTSSDRIGTPSGQSFYATFSKNLKPEINLPIAPYFGVTYSSYQKRFRPIAGLNIQYPKNFSSTVLFDGVHAHQLYDYNYKRHQFGFMLVKNKTAGVSYNISF